MDDEISEDIPAMMGQSIEGEEAVGD